MARQPESKLVSKIKGVIMDQGGRSFKIHGSDDGVQEVGIPDLLVCLWGQFVGIEVKLPGEDLRPRQRIVLREIYEAGGVAAIVETVEQARDLLSTVRDRRDIAKGICYVRGSVVRSPILLQ